ncbi:MAG: hypothetical protein V1658_03285, partial [Candidatus Micrarchaeota archaeon]
MGLSKKSNLPINTFRFDCLEKRGGIQPIENGRLGNKTHMHRKMHKKGSLVLFPFFLGAVEVDPATY